MPNSTLLTLVLLTSLAQAQPQELPRTPENGTLIQVNTHDQEKTVSVKVLSQQGGYWTVARQDGDTLVRVGPQEPAGTPAQTEEWTEINLAPFAGSGQLVLLFSPEPFSTNSESENKNDVREPTWLQQIKLRGNNNTYYYHEDEGGVVAFILTENNDT